MSSREGNRGVCSSVNGAFVDRERPALLAPVRPELGGPPRGSGPAGLARAAGLDSRSGGEREIKGDCGPPPGESGTRRRGLLSAQAREAVSPAAGRPPCARSTGSPRRTAPRPAPCPPPGTAGRPSLAALAASQSRARRHKAAGYSTRFLGGPNSTHLSVTAPLCPL